MDQAEDRAGKPEGEAPSAEPEEPLTPERIAEMARDHQWNADLQAWSQLVEAEAAELARAKLLMRIHHLGGLKGHLEQLRQEARLHKARLGILQEIRLELESKQPLPGPGELEVVQGPILVGPGPMHPPEPA